MSAGGCFGGIRLCLECLQGPSFTATPSYAQLKESHGLKLDTSFVGSDVVIVKNGHRICGTGGALAIAPIVQNKAYFEVKVQQTGVWGVGLASKRADLNKLPLGNDEESWVLREDGKLYHNGQVLTGISEPLEEGDVIGVAFDHIDLKFRRNGDWIDVSASGIKGTAAYPLVYVDDGAILDVQFTDFWTSPPAGFEEIMLEQTIL